MKKKIANIEVHSIALSYGEEHPLHIDKVEEWLEHAEENKKEYARLARKKIKSLSCKNPLACSLIHEGYIKEIKHYLRTGDWISSVYGMEQEHIVRRKRIA
jgi:hypothetical protein